MDDLIEIQVLPSLTEIPAAEWDACACPETADGGRPLDPFTTHRFLKALEDSGSVGRGTGWDPRYLAARRNGDLIAAAPLYVKSHSQGEYIFDFSWAHAYENAGGQYYPKLQVAVPFTPATGRRFLTRPGDEVAGLSALLQGAVKLAADNGLSSLHATFCTEAEAIAGERIGLMRRVTQQYHWENRGYADFDAFLADLSSRKRKTIRKERERANAFGGEIRSLTGDQIEPHHWDAFWRFYQDTGSRKWGTPYLTRAFFDIAQDTLRDDILLIMCTRDGRDVAGALNMIGREVLYGRYWGCVEHHDCLHFEACYYRAIDHAIDHGLSRVEAGAQGEHKLARGYLPSECHSLHWIGDRGFARAVEQFLEQERRAVEEDIEVLTAYGPFRKEQREEQD
ncbi:GNAT family N-acetyltransferase [Pseudooceanicola sp. LIPI14-2-Ac024]|uniref:GNAT family N-acetyltransferase n=1 Tax=Pseudooceanicola sp. LIPI14-2-Ac024 TaxID=3344875 RepID=UPI0035D0D80A